MKTVMRYQCEICKHIYDTVNEAIHCEQSGKEKPYPKGTQLVLTRNPSGFIVRTNCYIAKVEDFGHRFFYTLKAFDYNNKKYIADEIIGNKALLQKCRFL